MASPASGALSQGWLIHWPVRVLSIERDHLTKGKLEGARRSGVAGIKRHQVDAGLAAPRIWCAPSIVGIMAGSEPLSRGYQMRP